MEKGKSLKSINHSYHSHMRTLTSKGREKDILTSLSNGKNTYMRMDRLESSSFDSSWIEVIEDVIFDLGQIIANPKQVTKTEGNIVPIELARKTNAESVQHLASHTQYIKEVDDYGNVIPSKILTMIHEDDIKTYENRFIATFVRRLILFIEKRYEFVSKFAELHDESVLMFKNKSIVDGAEVEIETKIRVNRKSDDELSLKSNEYVARIKQMRQYILYFYNSDFMKKLKTEKDVHNPIIQTNIIRKNPLYHHCYEVYRFIERYEHLGVSYKVDEHFSLFDESELEELNRTIFANYITLKGKDRSANSKSSSKVYKPRILTSIDDEMFVYGPLFKGPIEFVRVDEGYQQYLDSKIRKDLPLHPTKKEKEYYEDEYAQKAENKEDQKEKEKLLKRVNKEVAAFNKAAAKIDQEREEARRKLEQMEKEIIKKEEDDMLAIARNEIISASLIAQEQAEKDYLRKEIDSVKVVEMSHPHSEPVTYEEAVEQIWPNVKNAPALRVVPKEEVPVVEEQPVVEEATVVEETPIVEAPKEEAKPVKVVEMSHPYSEPVTYDEAVKEIWPNIKDAPVLRVVPKVKKAPKKAPVKEAEPVKEAAPVVEEKPIVVVEMSHPYSEPVTYDEAVKEIWPNIKDAPILRVAPKEEKPVVKKAVKKAPQKKAAPVIDKQPKVEPVEEVKPVKVVEMSHPYSEPVTYEEATLEIWPQLANQPEPVKKVEEVPVNKQAPKKKAPAKKAPVKKAEPKQEPILEAPKKEEIKEEPIEKEVEKAPIKKAPKAKKAPVKKPEPVKEEPKEEAPKVEENKEEPKKVAPKVKKAPVMKKEPKKAPVKKPEPKKPAPKPAPKKEEKPREKIPGRFIVKLNDGYYVNKNTLSIHKDEAKVFDDFNLANDIKKARGGKVVKLQYL